LGDSADSVDPKFDGVSDLEGLRRVHPLGPFTNDDAKLHLVVELLSSGRKFQRGKWCGPATGRFLKEDWFGWQFPSELTDMSGIVLPHADDFRRLGGRGKFHEVARIP
jgi:hypothetical protein